MTQEKGLNKPPRPSKKASGAPKSNGVPEAGLSRRAAKRRRRKGKGKAVDQSSNGPNDIIDLTFDDTSRSSSISESARNQSKRKVNVPGPSSIPSASVISVAAFDPTPRSVLAGVSLAGILDESDQGPSSSVLGGETDIFIDETPAMNLAGPSKVSNAPTLADPTDAAPSTIASPSKSLVTPPCLLLPGNVTLDDPSDTSLESADPNDMEGLHFLDSNTTRGVSRYFDPETTQTDAEASFLATADQSKICSNCKRPGHKRHACPHTLCPVCGAVDAHERRDCPYSLVCFGCGQRGHRQTHCPDPTMRNSKKRGCDRCGARDHPENSCPSLWRQYAYYSTEARLEIQKTKRQSSGWQKEAFGGDEIEKWCYNCAKEGHLGDDCPQYRASGARLYTPSAFSYSMQSRGPFFVDTPGGPSGGPSMHRPVHKRWDEDETVLPFASKGFEGAEAGKRTRDKARRVMQSREEEEDIEDWFGRTRSGEAGIRAQQRDRERRTNGGYSRGGPDQGPRASRAARERRGGGQRLPFGHSDLMPSQQSQPQSARKPTIAFGKLSLPNGAAPATPNGMGRKPQGLPPPMTPKPGAKRQNGPGNGHNHANGYQRSDKSDKPAGGGKVKRKSGEDRDWEMEWQNSGIGGGSVVNWGKHLDREDKRVKKMKGIGKHGPQTPAHMKAQKGGKKAPGQRYTGAY